MGPLVDMVQATNPPNRPALRTPGQHAQGLCSGSRPRLASSGSSAVPPCPSHPLTLGIAPEWIRNPSNGLGVRSTSSRATPLHGRGSRDLGQVTGPEAGGSHLAADAQWPLRWWGGLPTHSLSFCWSRSCPRPAPSAHPRGFLGPATPLTYLKGAPFTLCSGAGRVCNDIEWL